VTLNAIGNITWKQGVGSYTYHATKKRAVIAAGSNSYGYDANGNMTTRNGSTIGYTSYNLPNLIMAGSNSSTLYYGANRNRYKQLSVARRVSECAWEITAGRKWTGCVPPVRRLDSVSMSPPDHSQCHPLGNGTRSDLAALGAQPLPDHAAASKGRETCQADCAMAVSASLSGAARSASRRRRLATTSIRSLCRAAK